MQEELHRQPQSLTPDTRIVDDGEPVEIQDLADVFRGFAEPLARSSEVAAVEGTNRAEIYASIAHKGLNYLFIIVFTIVLAALAALFMNKDKIAETLFLSLMSFLGGLGVGRSMGKSV